MVEIDAVYERLTNWVRTVIGDASPGMGGDKSLILAVLDYKSGEVRMSA